MPDPVDYTVETFCPHCGYKGEAAINVTGQGGPEPGAFSLCINCGQFAIFGKELKLRLLNEAEFVFAMSNDYMLHMRNAWKKMEVERKASGEQEEQERAHGPLHSAVFKDFGEQAAASSQE